MHCMLFPISDQRVNSLFCILAFIYHYLIVSYFSSSLELVGCWTRTLREKFRRLKNKHGKLKHRENRLTKAFNENKSSRCGKIYKRYVVTPFNSDKIERFLKQLKTSSSRVHYVIGHQYKSELFDFWMKFHHRSKPT